MSKIRSYFYRPKSQTSPEKPKRWKPMSILWTAIKKTCMIIGSMVLLSALISTCTVATLTMSGGGANAPLPDDMVLLFSVEQNVTELQTKPTFLDPFPFRQPTLSSIILGIDKAAEDDRVRGIVFSMKGGAIGIAHAQEIREAILRFRDSGKFAKIYAPNYADGQGGMVHYYLASAFDEIWMQPVGMLSIAGLSLEQPFAKKAMDKIGVSAQFLQREEFKSAMENFTNTEMSAENREALTSILNSWTNEVQGGVAEGRKVNKQKFSQLVDLGLFTGEEALEHNLIDRLDYADRILPEIQKEATGNKDDETVKLITLGNYAAQAKRLAATVDPKNSVALVYVSGSIVGSDKTGSRAGATEISKAINEAIRDDNVKSIVVRVNSPGGSPTASETIRRAIQKARNEGKPVYISMGSVAASGGYWIAAESDRIFATPGTLTGSIGVVMGKFEGSKLWDNLGVNWEGPQVGDNAEIWSLSQPFDKDALARLNVLIDSTYDAFLTRVAEGRKMSDTQVKQVAKGRPYTGAQALQLNLVDELGGLEVALDYAAQQLGAKDRYGINIEKFPKDLSGIEKFLELFGQEVGVSKFLEQAIGLDSELVKQTTKISDEFYLFTKESPIAVYDPVAASLR
ncbi:MAG: signal peptide peptidase SppA [Pseudomonadota bacterium]